MTTRYAHLRPDLFGDKALDAIPVDLSKPEGNVVSLPLASADSGADGARMTPPRPMDAEAKTA